MNLSHSFLYIIATVSILGLVGCSAPEPPPAVPLSVSDLAALDPEDLAAALSEYLDELTALYAEEVSLLETLWQFETDYGQVDTIQTAAGPAYRFRFYPRWRPNYIGPRFGADYDSVEEILEFRGGKVTEYRTLLTDSIWPRRGTTYPPRSAPLTLASTSSAPWSTRPRPKLNSSAPDKGRRNEVPHSGTQPGNAPR